MKRHRIASIATAVLGCLLGADAGAFELSSASHRILGSSLGGGGQAAMLSSAPGAQVSRLGSSIGQAEALGFSGSGTTLRTIAPGLWPIVARGFPTLDSDGDLIAAYRDNCPFVPNPTQPDAGGILSLAPDGIGDACQCGDVDDDGTVDDFDIDAYRDSLADPIALGLTPQGTAKCSVIDSPGPCEVLDVSVITRALEPAPLLPGIDQVCSAASPP